MNTSQFQDFVKGVTARVHEIIDETKDLGSSFQSVGLWRTIPTDQRIHRTQGVTGFNLLEEFDEGDGIKYDRTFPAHQTEYVPRQIGKGVTISQLLAKTRTSELEAKLDEVRQLRMTSSRTLDTWAWQVIADGFATTDQKFQIARLQDSVSMYSTAHTSLVPGVSNRSNRVASNPTLTNTSLFNAQKIIKEQLNGRGLPINYQGGFTLVVPPALEQTAFELVKSQLKANTTDNNINFFQGVGIDLVSSTYLGSANNSATNAETSWYLFARDVDTEQSMRYVTLQDPKIEQAVDFDTKTIKVSVDMAPSFGYSTFEFTAASDGSGS